jgi:hypothetical protein
MPRDEKVPLSGWDGDGLFALNFEANHGILFSGERRIPAGEIVNYINSRLDSNTSVVILTPEKGASWGELIPTLDACRRSNAGVVYLNIGENHEWLHR